MASLALLALVCLVDRPFPTHADAAAGRTAYDRGDFARAEAEWQNGADRDDADSEFGLGELYEIGAGDLQRDLKRADYWYQKAAKHGVSEAKYRLAMIWAEGGDVFPPDHLVEAYKWVILAAESKGVWSTPATELKDQLEKVTTAGQQAEGRTRAAAWREVIAAVTIAPPTPTSTPPPAPAGSPATTGCPGWPFPTLPCTDKPPPFANPTVPSRPPPPAAARPPSVAATPPDELQEALTRLDCASRHPETLPLCRSLAELRAIGLVAEGTVGLRLAGGKADLHEGDTIKVEVRAPAYSVNLRIDYFSLNGQVLHLWPNSAEPTTKLPAGGVRVFQKGPNDIPWTAGGAPFGTELITAIATPSPVDLGRLRPPVEPATDYLRDLKTALDHSIAGPETPKVVTPILVTTKQ